LKKWDVWNKENIKFKEGWIFIKIFIKLALSKTKVS